MPRQNVYLSDADLSELRTLGGVQNRPRHRINVSRGLQIALSQRRSLQARVDRACFELKLITEAGDRLADTRLIAQLRQVISGLST